MIENAITTNENLVQDISNELIFGHTHNGVKCAVCPTAKRACDRVWFSAKQIEEWSEMSKKTLWRWLERIEKARRIASVSDMTQTYIQDSCGVPHETTLYNLNVLNQLAMACIDNEKLNEVSCKFSDILSEVETTGSYSVNQTQNQPAMLPNFCNPAEAARAWADLYEKNQAAEKRALTAETELSYEKEAHEKDNEDFRNGLDILNAQKAQIGSKREATAMATASSARAHQHFAEKVLETHASELIALRAAVEERRAHLWDANRTAQAIYRLNVLKKEYSLNTIQNKARKLLSHFATKLGKPSISLPNGSTYTDPFGRLQTSVSTYYERDVADAVLDWVIENPNDFARLGGKRDPLQDEW